MYIQLFQTYKLLKQFVIQLLKEVPSKSTVFSLKIRMDEVLTGTLISSEMEAFPVSM